MPYPHKAHLDLVQSSPSVHSRTSCLAIPLVQTDREFGMPLEYWQRSHQKEEGKDSSQYERFRKEPVAEIDQENNKKAVVTTKQTL